MTTVAAMSVVANFVITVSLIVVSTAAGYLARKRGWLAERRAEPLMTFVFVFGYSIVGFLSIWNLRIRAEDFWLPVLGALHVIVMTAVGLPIGRLLTRDRQEAGLFAIAAGMGNNGFTMGGFIVYLLYGSTGLGLVGIYGLAWTPVVVFVMYPLARAFAGDQGSTSLGRLLLRSIFDWRSIGLAMAIIAVCMSRAEVPYPSVLKDYPVIDALVFLLTPMAYFSIGMRLHLGHLLPYRRLIVGLALVRTLIGAAVGLGLVWASGLLGRGVSGQGWGVFMVEAFVPTAVTTAAIANMFRLQPRLASTLFVTSSLMYLLLVLPVVLWLFGGR